MLFELFTDDMAYIPAQSVQQVQAVIEYMLYLLPLSFSNIHAVPFIQSRAFTEPVEEPERIAHLYRHGLLQCVRCAYVLRDMDEEQHVIPVYFRDMHHFLADDGQHVLFPVRQLHTVAIERFRMTGISIYGFNRCPE